MKHFYVKGLRLLWLILGGLMAAFNGMAQYSTPTTVATGGGYSALAKDKQDNIYVNTGRGDGTLQLIVNGTGISNHLTGVPFQGDIYTIDKTAPTGTLSINGKKTFTTSTEVLLDITSTDATRMRFSTDSTTWTTYEAVTTSKNYTLPAGDGLKTVFMQLADQPGNVQSYKAQIILDQTPPEGTIVSGPPANTNNTIAYFVFHADETAIFECSLDGSAISLAKTNFGIPGLKTGPHTLVATARDDAGNLDLTPATYSWTVDTTAPAISQVDVPANGYYHAGDVLSFTVRFNDNVTVDTTAGTPTLDVMIGAVTRQATYVSGSGSSLTFRYTVQDGEMDMDGIRLGTALVLHNGTIMDAAGNNALLPLHNTGSTTRIYINTASPTIVLSTTVISPVNQPFPVTITFSEVVTGLTAGDITVSNATISNLQTTDNITYTALITPTADGAVNMKIPAGAAVNIGNNDNAASNTLTLTYDHTKPAITSVDVPARATYKSGELLTFKVHYSEDVIVNDTPALNIVIGNLVHPVPFTGGSGSNALTFSYTVQNGDFEPIGIDVGVDVILNSGTIRDAAGNDANLTLQNLGNTTGVLVDASAPVVSSVSVPVNGYYKTGNTLNFIVHFNENVTVNTTNGIPSLEVMMDANTRQATYVSGDGSSALIFSYTVQNGEMDMDGIGVGSLLKLNGGTLRDVTGNDVVLALNKVGDVTGVFVNTSIPTVALSTTATSPLNQPFPVTITFSEAVTGLTAGDITVSNATISNLQTTDNITYTALITPTADGAVNMKIPAGAAVNIGNNDNAASNTLTLTYDHTKPDITAVDVPADATYKRGETLTFTVHYNEQVTVSGTPSLNITIDSSTRSAVYTGGSGGNALTFSYTVQDHDQDLDGITLGANVVLNSAGIADATGNDASPLLNNIAATTGVLIDATAPVVSSVSVPANGYYKTGNTLNFTVHFNENVTISTTNGIPSLEVTIGAVTRQATYVSGDGSSALTFSYTVQNGEMDMDGIALGTTLALNNSTIRDAAGNDAILALNKVGDVTGVFVNTSVPTVALSTTATSPLNQPFPVTIIFSEAVTGLTAGDITVSNATISNLQTTDNITYTALITPTADGTVSAKIPAGAAMNIGNNDNTVSNTITRSYDHTAPAVTSVEVPTNAIYKNGETLNFTVHFSENVTVNTTSGTPSLQMTIGSAVVNVPYISGNGSKTLLFRYTVQNGDMDMDGISLGTDLLLNTGTIQDTPGNNTLTPLNNAGNTTTVLVNTQHPSVVLSTNAAPRVNTPVTLTITFSEVVSGFSATDLTTSNATVSNLQTTDNISYTAIATAVADGDVNISLPAGAAVNIGNNENTASGVLSFTYDGTAPVINQQTFDVNNDSPAGTLVGKLTATGAGLQNWIITSDGSGGAFTIDATGVITVKDAVILNPKGGTTVSVTVTVSDGLNTSTPTQITIHIRQVFVNQAPTLDVIANENDCAGTDTHTIPLTGISAVEPGQTYNITVTADQPYFDVLTVNAAGVLSYKLKAGITTGTSMVTVTVKDNGGTTNGGADTRQRTFSITVNSLPVVNISSSKGGNVSKGDVIQLTATGGSIYNWTVADGIISGQQSDVLQARAMANTTYQVTVTNAAGCSNTGTISIAVIEDFKVEATNILTPNGDGKNDKWVIRNLDSYPDNEVKIYDRTGRMVYQRRNYSNDWDGTINGNPLAEGTYYYILTINGNTKTAKGYITIIRDQQ